LQTKSRRRYGSFETSVTTFPSTQLQFHATRYFTWHSVNFQNTIHNSMNSTKHLGCCSMNRYCDSWCTDVWRLREKREGIYGGGGRMEEKETPASRRMCSSRQTRTGRCWERTASR
jgi:hypothetical protein